MENANLIQLPVAHSGDIPSDVYDNTHTVGQLDSMPLFCSGYGQFHSNKPKAKTKNPYVQINLEGIRKLVDNPQQVDKRQAQWIIPSSLLSRIFKEQEINGKFWMLWSDIDQNSKGIYQISGIVDFLISGCDYEIYTSKSATKDNQKCRILIPLSKLLSGSDWIICQEILNDMIESGGIIPDRASERPAQLCYLPNRGEFYDSESLRDGKSFDPIHEWSEIIQQKRDEIKTHVEELIRLKKQAQARREEFKSLSGTSALPDLIRAFNEAYTIQEILLQAGYDQRGNTFRHPNSESGSYSASVKNGRVHSLSSNDPLYTNGSGIGAHDAFSAFTVLFCNNDRNAALKEAGEKWMPINGAAWNKVKQQGSYTELLSEASAMDKNTTPDAIQELVSKISSFSLLQQQRIFETIKNNTGTPLKSLRDTLREEIGGNYDKSDLELARDVIHEIGRENIIATQGFVWRWSDKGLWQPLDKRAVKQIVQDSIARKVKAVSKHLVDGVSDLFETEIYQKDHIFNTGNAECVNCLNGEVILVNGSWILQPHTREHYRTSQIPVAFHPQATAPRFEKFLDEIFVNDLDKKEKKQALLELIGYTLMAHCRYEKFVILVGSGANGKSVFLSILESLVGSENIAGVQPSCFDRSFHRAHLHGKLANIVTEIKQGEVIDDASLKSIVSGEPTTVEHKFKDPFVMRPFATCWFGTNHLPHTRDFSDALFRRALVFTFNQVFKPELGNCDPKLKESLTSELPGILNLSLRAYADAVEKSFTTPQSCIDARNNWRMEADQVLQFIEDECVRNPKEEAPVKSLYEAYLQWASVSGVNRTVGMKSFRDRLTNLGFGSRRTATVRYVTGLAVNMRTEDNFCNAIAGEVDV